MITFLRMVYDYEMNDQYCIYIMSNPNRTVLYIGMTSDIAARILSHRQKLVEGFTKEYNCIDCVYFEFCENRENALLREKQLKGWR